MASQPVDLHAIIHALYDAGLDPERWGAALEMLGDALGGCALGSTVQRANGFAGTLAHARLDPHYFTVMTRQFPDVRGNEMVAAMSALPAAVAVGRQAVKSDDAYFRSGLYNEIFAPQGLAHAAVACAFRSADCFVPLGIFRRKGQEEFTQREYDLLKVVLPHLQRAVQIGLRLGMLEARQAASDDLLDHLPLGVILLDAAGTLLRMNAAAQDIVAANDGLSVRHGKLCAASNTDHALLQRVLASSLSLAAGNLLKDGAAMAVSRPSMARPFLLMAIPSPGTTRLSALADGGAIVLVVDPDRQLSIGQSALMRLFDLTPTESSLALLLAAGLTLDEAARRMKITHHTVRVHLKAVFRKMGVNRQSELIRVIINLAMVTQARPFWPTPR